ncbi:hypothetical protein L6164_000534 [Bauhinia variegata]|uniref:Uncharacterized protein n=1 Tax=Bauhinia variegata TaxID=167791 RepID=A0ACB9Q6B9_BAUVA|nr:hypothetical protein L6164_000534 [Bauhinia variegata]
MEGLIPFVYKAIMQYKNGKEGSIGSWLCESPSYSYIRLPAGDSGRFQTSASSLFHSSPSSKSSTSATQVRASSTVESRIRRRVAA